MLKHLQRMAIQKVMKTASFNFDQDFWGDLIVQGCVKVKTNFKVSKTEEFSIYTTVRSRDYYTPDDWDEHTFKAPSTYEINLSGAMDLDCVEKELGELVTGDEVWEAFVESLEDNGSYGGGMFYEALEDLTIELEDDWRGEASDYTFEDWNVSSWNVKNPKYKVVGDHVTFSLTLQVNIEVEGLQFDSEY